MAKGPCPNCPSSDGYETYDDGHGHCFVCGYHNSADGEAAIKNDKVSENFTPLTTVFHPYPSRRIGRESVKRFGVLVNQNEASDVEAYYPVFRNGEHVGNKIRRKGKVFHYEGSGKDLDLFGQHAFPAGSAKAVTIVEGQDDALAAFEISPFPVVSVHGAGSAVADVKRAYEYLDSFETIVICFDNDGPGNEAAAKVATLFKPGKVKVLQLREFKDANDYLANGRGARYVKEWFQAPTVKPDGLKFGTDMWDDIINRPNHFSVKWPFERIQKLTGGIRLSEFILIHAPTGIGKTSIIKETEYALLTDPEIVEKGYGVGFLHLEEPNHDTALGLMSIHNSKPYHLPDTERTTDELRTAYDAVINTDRVVVWDHFGSNSVDAVLDKVRHMHALGCKYIVVDHLSIIVSDQSGDERKQLDEISTKLKTICMEMNIALICIIHQNRAGMVRGTAGVEQVANIVIRLEREKTDVNEWRRNVLKTTVEKNRFSGQTGPASYLHYNLATNRLEELDGEEIIEYESGSAPRDDAAPW